jgi:hypothetical protein
MRDEKLLERRVKETPINSSIINSMTVQNKTKLEIEHNNLIKTK